MSTNNSILGRPVPGDNGLPLIGHTLEAIRDIKALYEKKTAKHGPIFKTRFLGENWIRFSGPEMAQFLLQDPNDVFSKRDGWASFVEKFFPRGLMLKDGADHRHDRKIMQSAFNSSALKQYEQLLNVEIEALLNKYLQSTETIDAHELSMNLVVELSSSVFLGESDPATTDKLKKAFRDTVEATMAIVRKPIPGTKYYKGLKGRQYLESYFQSKVAEKRLSNESNLFSNLCKAVDENGNKFTDQQVCDHMIFLLMAANDTTCSALTSVIYWLTEYPEWQYKLNQEIQNLQEMDGKVFATNQKLLSCVFKESIRLFTPGAIIPRKAKRNFQYKGYDIPAGSIVSIAPIHNHYDPDYWTRPNDFDPERFLPERAEDKQHKFLFIPFSGGAAQCIGMHFAELEIKVIVSHLLRRYALSRDTSKTIVWTKAPVWHPKSRIEIQLARY
ncbi:cytochrome P450 [Reinekea sp. G2M2-21]|uniref:cytochrome P450 n=1 Tax=Reinekea sp. G2M2-21 TaxID=2788942 RepID=UPI0018AACDB4|nr:cytochrome P450 [Reinekea sp. G2M2-21]